MIHVNVIRAFEGPRHQQLELLWRWYANMHANQMKLCVFDNTKLQLSHATAYERMWEQESRRDARYTIFTEFDFLPGPDFLKVRPDTAIAAQYVVRDPTTKDLRKFSFPGAWFVMIDKDTVQRPNFSCGGPFNDPCNQLDATLLDTTDCYPRHYGVQVADVGEHLFWSRHYNDDPDSRPAGFHLRPILEGVDRAIKDWLSRP